MTITPHPYMHNGEVVTWTPEMDARLGTDYDATIAKELGIVAKQVEHRRNILGIPAVTAKQWTPEEDALLGTDSLVKLAARLNRPTSQIDKRRKLLGIPPFAPRGRDPSPARAAERAAERAAQAERNKARWKAVAAAGLAASRLIASGNTLAAAALKIGSSSETIRQRLHKFNRRISHDCRLGQHLSRPVDIARTRPDLLDEIERRLMIEFETGSLDVWRDPLSDTQTVEADPC